MIKAQPVACAVLPRCLPRKVTGTSRDQSATSDNPHSVLMRGDESYKYSIRRFSADYFLQNLLTAFPQVSAAMAIFNNTDMDIPTITAYNTSAIAIADLHETLIPDALYARILEFFKPQAITLDVGCGSGRDTAWLRQNGFDASGLDASEGMLFEARKRHPEIVFNYDSLPALQSIETSTYTNILCSAVIMHLPINAVAISASNLMRILIPHGTLLLSFRNSHHDSKRENDKLYESLSTDWLVHVFELAGATLVMQETTLETARNNYWHTMVFRKN